MKMVMHDWYLICKDDVEGNLLSKLEEAFESKTCPKGCGPFLRRLIIVVVIVSKD